MAIQFPDHLLSDSARVAMIMKKELGRDVYILGDTSYGRYVVYMHGIGIQYNDYMYTLLHLYLI